MTKQIDLPVRTKYRQTRSGPRDWAVAVGAIVIVLLVLAIVGGSLILLLLKIWTGILSMM